MTDPPAYATLWVVRIVRFDVSPLGKVQRTSSGAARIPAVLSRSGVFEYMGPGGEVIREYRPPEEVLRADSMASLEDAPVTIGHPPAGVTPDTWAKDSVGHVRAGDLRADETVKGIAASVIVARKDALARVDSRDLVDISPGYSVDIDNTPGVTPDGQPYDRIQRNIQYNHVALLPKGGGRQGSAVGLRLDSAGNQISAETSAPTPKNTMKITLRFDGKDREVEAGSLEHVQLQTQIDAAKDNQIATLTADVAKEKARADAAEKTAAEQKARLDAAEADKAKAARTALETSARGVLGAEVKFDAADGKPLSDRAVRELVIKRADSAFDGTGKTDAYVEARFDLALASTRRSDASAEILSNLRGQFEANTQEKPTTRVDAAPTIESDPIAYMAAQNQRAFNLGRSR